MPDPHEVDGDGDGLGCEWLRRGDGNELVVGEGMRVSLAATAGLEPPPSDISRRLRVRSRRVTGAALGCALADGLTCLRTAA